VGFYTNSRAAPDVFVMRSRDSQRHRSTLAEWGLIGALLARPSINDKRCLSFEGRPIGEYDALVCRGAAVLGGVVSTALSSDDRPTRPGRGSVAIRRGSRRAGRPDFKIRKFTYDSGAAQCN
jgi:hypothetical protein